MSPTMTKSQRLLYSLIQKLGNEVDQKVKLAKLAYFADFIHYAFYNTPISEETTLYQKRNFGPLSVSFNSDLKEMVTSGLLSNPKQYNYKIEKVIEVDLSETEKKVLDYVLNKYSQYSYDVLADISHKQTPYISAVDGGVIEYNTAYNLVEEYPDYIA